jgi:hypothetical protein
VTESSRARLSEFRYSHRFGVVLTLTFIVTLVPITTAGATPPQSGVIKFTLSADSEGSMPIGDICGFPANVYEKRSGTYFITLHTKGRLAGVANIVGRIAGTPFIVTATGPNDTRSWTGTYKEVTTTTVVLGGPGDQTFKTLNFHLIGKAMGTDGSRLRIVLSEHLVVDAQTGAVQHDASVTECLVR